MSHAEAFGHFRSFVIGLEKNARALRRVLEDPADGNAEGKWANALESQSPEVTTKELIEEVAEQDKALSGAEALVQAEKPIDEVSEKYHALAEYNQLAFADLEERLSAYGYVRPTLASAAPGKGASLISKAEAAVSRKNEGASTPGGVDEGDESEVAGGHAPSQDCRGGKHSVPSEANASSQQDNGVDSGGGETRAGPEEELAVPVETGPIDDDAAVVATPVHHSAAAIIPEEEQGGDEDSPATPTLADWEISEGTREMLRLDHLQKQRQVKGGSGYSPVGTARSLEVLLAQHSAVAIAGNNHHHEQGDHLQQGADGGAATTTVAGEVARSSVSSSWSPPHLNTPMSDRQRRSSISSGIGTRLGIVSGSGSGGGGSGGSGGGRGGGGEEGGVSDGCQISAGGGRRDEERRIEMAPASPWRSDPPTPRMPCLGSGEPSTPNGRDFGARDVESEVSVDSPVPVLSSPMRTEVGRSLMEVAMNAGNTAREIPRKISNGSSVTRVDEEGREGKGCSQSLIASPDPTPGRALAEVGDGSCGSGGRSTELGDDFWGGNSPASPVCVSREASGESPPAPGAGGGQEDEEPLSPETPRTPPMPTPRYFPDVSIRDGGRGSGGGVSGGGGGSVPGHSVRSTRSGGETHRTPTLSAIYGGSRANSSRGGSGGSGGHGIGGRGTGGSVSGGRVSCRYISGGEEKVNNFDDGGRDGDGYSDTQEEDEDDCRTPELSSPVAFAQNPEYGVAADAPGASAALCWRRLEEAEEAVGEEPEKEERGGGEEVEAREGEGGEPLEALGSDGPLELVSQEEYAKAPTFITIQVSRGVLNEAIRNLNAYAAPRLETPSELLLTADEMTAIIDHGELSRTLLLFASHFKRVEMKGSRMYRIRGSVG